MGVKIREVVLSADSVFEPKAEALLMLADRAHHVESFIRPVLESGRHVVSDRYSASTLAYQGFGRGLDISLLESMTSWILAGLSADLNVLIDLPVEESLKRAASRTGSALTDRFESQGAEFLGRVAEGFRTLSRQAGTDWFVVDGRSNPEEIHRQICRELESRFPGIVEG
jgi:dTMP kinase